MRQIAIIGSGPAGYYTAEALLKAYGDGVAVDILDRLPVPYGLIRFGVAPDHQSIKAVTRRYDAVSLSENVRFAGNVTVGRDVTIKEMQGLYDAVVLATGAPVDRPIGIEGEDLPGVLGSAAFVGWYNGHPDFAFIEPPLDGRQVVVIGNGNVALDCARILAKTTAEFTGSDIVAHARDALAQANTESIVLIGRRGPHQIAMTPKELSELSHLERASARVDPADFPDPVEDMMLEPGQRKSVTLLREFAAIPVAFQADKPIEIEFDFFASPVRIEGDGRVERLIVERTTLDTDGRAVGTGEEYAIPASLIITCIGYRTPPLPGVPFDDAAGRFANDEGRIGGGLYCAGWARRGPSGTIGTNKPDGYNIADLIVQDLGEGNSGKAGRLGLDELLNARGIKVVRFRDWQKLDQAEMARANEGHPREKFVEVQHMLEALFGESGG